MPSVVGVSLKMYFGPEQTRAWVARVAELARTTTAVRDGAVELFVIPGFLSIPAALAEVAGTPIAIGAQDVFWEDSGAFTGEVGAPELAELGVRFVEVGHAERRRLFGETDEVVARKTAAALRHGLVPVLCLGETEAPDVQTAIDDVLVQLDAALDTAPGGRVVVAYEPVWAIGADEPAPDAHIVAVCRALRTRLRELDRPSSVIYGGSAGPGLLSRLGDAVDGLFLGRFAHDPAALAAVLEEAAA